MAEIKVEGMGKNLPRPLVETRIAPPEATKGDRIEPLDGFGVVGTYINVAKESEITLFI